MSKVLFDLSPALDGFAGIPMETRLTFTALRKLRQANLAVDGLIQTANDASFGAIPESIEALDPHERYFYMAKFIAGILPTPDVGSGRLANYRRLVRSFRRRQAILRSARRAIPLKLMPIDAPTFHDFIWKHLFVKSISSDDKSIVCADRFWGLNLTRSQMFFAMERLSAKVSQQSLFCIDTAGYDFFISQSPIAATVSKNTALMVRYHDSVPIYFPHTIQNKDDHLRAHYKALRQNVADGAQFVCVSQATRRGLLKLFPEIGERAHVVPNIVPEVYYNPVDESLGVEEILSVRTDHLQQRESGARGQAGASEKLPHADFPYLLIVSTIEPRKNHGLLLDAFEMIKYSGHDKLKLIVVGSDGWGNAEVMARLERLQARGEAIRLAGVPAEELRVLYRYSAATVCPSVAEGFDYSGVEGMASGGLVVASDIEVHREVYGDAAVYFDPYDVGSLQNLIEKILEPEFAGERKRLIQVGQITSAAYRFGVIQNHWAELFSEVAHTSRRSPDCT